MIITPFLIAFGFGFIKCSQIKQNKVKIPLLKGEDDQQFSMNHMNVLLQSLYNSCPLRNAIFSSEAPVAASAAVKDSYHAVSNPLELIFAKMHYDIENRGDVKATEASIYFKDSYLKSSTTTDPIEFYSWITRDLFESEQYRSLLQFEILTRKKSLETTSKVFIEDYFDYLAIQSEKFRSVQAYLDDFFSTKTEEVVVTSDGESHQKTVEISKELANPPTIATFLIKRQTEFEDFGVEETINLNREYKLNSFIIFEDGKYSACIKAKDSSWYKIQDDSYTKLEDDVFILASKFGYILFYIGTDFDFDSFSCSPKPSHELIMDSLTKTMIHGISKTVQKQTNSPPVKPPGLPLKTKNMATNEVAYSSLNNNNVSPLRSSSHLSLQDLTMKKAPSSFEFANLEAILVRADLSDVKMNLLTTAQAEVVKKDETTADAADTFETRKHGESFDSFGLFIESLKEDEDDVELDYFKEIDQPQHKPKPSRSMGIWSQHYLKQPPQPSSYNSPSLFAGLLDFEIDFHESHAAAPVEKADSEDDEELFMKATLAKIRKYHSDDKQIVNAKKQHKKSPAQIQETRSMLSKGLFHRPSQKSILPDEQEQEQGKDPKDNENFEKKVMIQKEKEGKRVNRYAKF